MQGRALIFALVRTLCTDGRPDSSVCAIAQLGFFGILLVEALAGKGIFEMAGFTVGNGLGFEF